MTDLERLTLAWRDAHYKLRDKYVDKLRYMMEKAKTFEEHLALKAAADLLEAIGKEG